MNKFVYGALALTTVGGAGFAGSGTEEWLNLDRELAGLASVSTSTAAGFSVGGFLRSSYVSSSDVTVGTNDLGGFSIDDARLILEGATGAYSLFVSLNGSTDPGFGYFGVTGAGGPAAVLDATGSVALTEQIKLSMGQFMVPFLASARVPEHHMLFIDHTINGDIWKFRDRGVMLNGNFDQLGWWISGQNGADGVGDDHALGGRVAFNALGTGVGMASEGAWGAGAESNLTLGVGYYDDSFLTDGTATCFDAAYTRGALSLAGELVDYDDGLAGPLGSANVTPWTATVGYMFADETWEAALRYEDFDDTDDSTLLRLGVNYYIAGHNAKWQFNYTTIDSDLAVNEIDTVAVGMAVGV